MLIPFEHKAFCHGKLKKPLALLILTVLLWTVPAAAGALVDPIPKEIKDFSMGLSAESVIRKIKGSGTHTTEPVVAENRSKLVWTPARSPYYKEVIFQFTEKDRLFQIRFNLTAPARSNATDLKKAFFELYDFYRENPMRLRVKDSDITIYGPGKNKHEFLLEFTDRNTGQKSFELFDRDISASDRPVQPKADKTGAGTISTDSAPGPLPSPVEKGTPQTLPLATDSASPQTGTK